MRTSNRILFCLIGLALCCLTAIGCGGKATGTSAAAANDAAIVDSGALPISESPAEREIAVAGESPWLLDVSLAGDQVTVRYRSRLWGDSNLDGEINGIDVFPIATKFQVEEGGEGWDDCVDANRDGVIDGKDLFTIAARMNQRIDYYGVYRDSELYGSYLEKIEGVELEYLGCDQDNTVTFTSPIDPPYWITLRAYDTEWGGFGEDSTSYAVDHPPAVPTGLTATVSEEEPLEVYLEWDPVESEDPNIAYNLFRVEGAPGPPWDFIPSIYPLAETTYTHSTVGTEETWYYAVRSVKSNWVYSELSPIISVTTTDPVPLTPKSYKIESGDGRLYHHWDIVWIDDFASYNIYHRAPREADYVLVHTIEKKHDHEWVHEGLENDLVHRYKLTCTDQGGQESEATYQSGTPSLTPAIPTGLTAEAVSTKEIRLSWDANSETDLNEYLVYSSLDTPDNMQQLYIRNRLNETTFTDCQASPGETWYYAISATDNYGIESPMSDPVMVTPLAAETAEPHLHAIDIGYHEPLYPSMTLDGYGVPWVSYYDSDRFVCTTRWFNGGAWTSRNYEDDADMGNLDYTATVYDPIGGKMFVGFAHELGSAYARLHENWSVTKQKEMYGEGLKMCADNTGGAWTLVKQVIDNDDYLALANGGSHHTIYGGKNYHIRQPSIACAPDNTPFVAFGCGELFYGSYQNWEWHFAEVPDTQGGGNQSSIDFSPEGEPWIAHLWGENVAVSHREGDEWFTVLIEDSEREFDMPKICFAPDGMPSVAYFDVTDSGAQELKLATFNGSDWSTETILTGDWYDHLGWENGQNLCLEFDAQGHPAISLLDARNQQALLYWWY